MHAGWLLVVLFSLLSLSSSVNGLNIHSTNSSSSIPLSSQYTTIGSYPTKSQFYNITIVQSSQVDGHTFHPEQSSAGEIAGRMVIFVGDIPISAAALAYDANKYGAVAIIFQQLDHFRGGRAVAFNTPVHIPVVVVSSSVLDQLVNDASSISSIELTAISSSEKSLIGRMKAEVNSLIIIVIIIYAALIPFFLYLFIFEVIYVYKMKGRYFSHNCLMKLVAVFTAVLWLLWIAVDPMGFKVKPHWDENVVCFLAGAFLIALYLLILRILVLIVSSTHFSSWHKTFISRTLAATIIVLFILLATVWMSPTVGTVFKFFLCVSVLVLGILFAIVGKLMIDTLIQSGNRSHKANMIIARLSGFIAYYGIVSVVLLGTVHGHFANSIYTTFVCGLLHSVGLVITFLLLFLRFPSQMHKHSLRSTSSGSNRDPSKQRLPSEQSFTTFSSSNSRNSGTAPEDSHSGLESVNSSSHLTLASTSPK